MVPFRYEDLKSRDLNKNYNNKPFITCSRIEERLVV